ncbi:peptide chain release factor 1 [candidate division GN15 bacterium]|nr:peptide chain release factor 1 [candidate division GN15 bacterium]
MISLVEDLEKRLAEIDKQMTDPQVLGDQQKLIELSQERRRVESTLKVGRDYREVQQAVDEAREIVKADEDPELVAMAREELERYEDQLPELERRFRLKLLPRDPNDDKDAVVEVRAGTGGDEAALFTGDIFRMYQRYAEERGWTLEVLASSPSEVGGFKEIVFSLAGEEAFGRMKYESGVHRVQRVPATETQGRIHTSACSVAVFPEAEEVDIEIKENEIKVDVYRSSGPGGQSVNTTDSAVRITHIPTGLVVTCQDEKSQLKNRQKALKVLRARLLDAKMAEQQAKISAERRSMVSTGDRSAKIRTYNFPQSRVTDHRINLTLYKLDDVLAGHVDLLIDELRQHDQEKRLRAQQEAQEISR